VSELLRTPSQTIGPFFAVGLPWPDGPTVVPEGTAGSIWVRGRVLDGHGDPVADALIETWQAGSDGRFGAPDAPGETARFRGFGRCATDIGGSYAILTVKPGAVPTAGGAPQAPHVDVSVFARGLLKRVVSRIYFADEEAQNDRDPVLSSVMDPAMRATLIAERTDDGYRFDIRLQGQRETVFFDV
jgi:protocatechuate 3,4-dioxygenase alpha subunit